MNNTILNSYSGIMTHQFGLDSVSNNIANVNTNGYKENIPEFKSLLSTHLDSMNANSAVSNDQNYGATGASNAISTKAGNYHASEGEFDMAYQGKGWFILGQNQKGEFSINEDGYEAKQANYFSRNGSFSRDSDGYLVNSGGYYVYGVDLGKIQNGTFMSKNDSDENITALASSKLTPLNIPQELKFQPVLTSKVNASINLNPKSEFKSAEKFLLSTTKELLEDRVKNQDFNALANNDDEPLDMSIFNNLTLSITQNEEKKDLEFKYGTKGKEANEFRTIGDLSELIKEKTGLDFNISMDKEGKPKTPLSLSLSNPIENGVDMNLTIGGKLSEKIGLKAIDLAFKQGQKEESNPIKIPTYTTSIEIYDKEGKKFLLKSDYFMSDSGNKNATPPIEQKWEVTSGIYDFKGEYLISENPINQTISFDKDGKINAEPIELDFKGEKLEYSLTNSKDYQSTNLPYEESKLTQVTQDGKIKGSLREVRIDDNGIIFLAFDNGVTESMGRIGIAAFSNDQGLKKVGSNLFEMSSGLVNGENKTLSGDPILGWNTEDGKLKFGKVLHKYLETSNVDVGNALTNLILMQRGYSMNAKAFNTGDDLIKEAINLKK